eukprot:TRINITY_DN10936_c0_g1_i1.p1 TRINITY_DN10936_c0_g1~~TRINITY_DN10936_c0_g1_i1.p1  ORF type:complete len:372 (-),score=67.53 TRINITY_DN10936_c0_g1_i1:210-1325(-)
MSIPGIEVDKRQTKQWKTWLEHHSYISPLYKIKQCSDTTVAIPLVAMEVPVAVDHPLATYLAQFQMQVQLFDLALFDNKATMFKGVDLARNYLRVNHNWDEDTLLLLPEKWIKYNDIIVLSCPENALTQEDSETILQAYRTLYPDLKAILISEGAIGGELRKPTMINFTNCEDTVTTVIENGIKYKFDVMKVMYSPGNDTERKRCKNMIANENELVMDMFAGLGYFSIPFAQSNLSKITELFAIEKNQVSFSYLTQNIELNKIQSKMHASLGDNRVVGDEYQGKANRIFMGYLPETAPFIERALYFADLENCIFHYHHLAEKNEFESRAIQDFTEVLNRLGIEKTVVVVEFAKVKSYAPRIFHCVADIRLQ